MKEYRGLIDRLWTRACSAIIRQRSINDSLGGAVNGPSRIEREVNVRPSHSNPLMLNLRARACSPKPLLRVTSDDFVTFWEIENIPNKTVWFHNSLVIWRALWQQRWRKTHKFTKKSRFWVLSCLGFSFYCAVLKYTVWGKKPDFFGSDNFGMSNDRKVWNVKSFRILSKTKCIICMSL